MEPGSLRDVVQLQSPSTAQDDAGQPSGSWTTVATIRADIRHQGGLEALRAGAEVSTVRASARIRYRASISAGMRLRKNDGTLYEIKAVLRDAARRYVDLVCEVVQ